MIRANLQDTLNYFRKYVQNHGLKIGSTMETIGPPALRLVLNHRDLEDWICDLQPLISPAIERLERREYAMLKLAAKKAVRFEFVRDPLSRRAVVLHHGCITYQHFALRGGMLYYIVHCRGLDLAKLPSDLQLFCKIGQAALRAASMVQPTILDTLLLQISVDCLHEYLE